MFKSNEHHTLDQHISKHSETKFITSPECKFSVYVETLLTEHIGEHTDCKPHEGSNCGKAIKISSTSTSPHE